MTVNLNRLNSDIFETKLIKLPKINEKDFSIYKKYAPGLEKISEKKIHFKKEDVNSIANQLEFRKNVEFHQFFSVSLLAASTAMIATAATMAALVNPLFALLALGTLIPSFVSVVNMTVETRNSYEDVISCMSFIPLLMPSLYVYESFSEEATSGVSISKRLNSTISHYREIHQKKEKIERKVRHEIRSLSGKIVDIKTEVDFAHLADLRHALKQLKTIGHFLGTYKSYAKTSYCQ